MSRPCTCQPCQVCGEGKCDCTCKHGPHVGAIDLYPLRIRLADMPPAQRDKFIADLTKDLPK